MAYAYRRKDRSGKSGPVWWFRFKDDRGRWKSRRGWPDKRKTLEHAVKLEADCRAAAAGEKPRAWIAAKSRPIAQIVDEYISWGAASGGRYGRPWPSKSRLQKMRWLAWWTEELGLRVLGDIGRAEVEQAAGRMRTRGLAPKSIKSTVSCLQAFCNWAVRREYMERTPLASMPMDVRAKAPHRALTDEELTKLLAVAPPERRLWYEVALQTGYRVDELRHLTVKSLDVFGPSLFLSGDFTKNRKDARQPINRELADKLVDLAAGQPPEASLLNIPTSKAWKLFKGDIRRATIEEEIAGKGKATWHSLRKCLVSRLVASGVDLKTVMELARHSAAQLTLEVYADAAAPTVRAAAAGAAEYFGKLRDGAPCDANVTRSVAVAGGEPLTLKGTEGNNGGSWSGRLDLKESHKGIGPDLQGSGREASETNANDREAAGKRPGALPCDANVTRELEALWPSLTAEARVKVLALARTLGGQP